MKRHFIFLSTVIYFSFSLIRAQDIGLDFYRHLSNLPYLYPNVESYYVSSYDRTGGNDDGFRGTYSQLYEDENGDHVIFDENGPGCIYNMWGTGPEKIPNWGKIKLYFDGEKKPRLEMDANDLFSGLYKPFIFPLINHQYVSSGGFSSCALFPFAKSLKITTEKKVYFYNIYYQLYKDVDIQSWNPDFEYTDMVERFQRRGSDPKQCEPDSVVRHTVTLTKKKRRDEPVSHSLLDMNHGGVIQYIKMNPLYSPDMFNLNHIFLKITFDNQNEASVHVPIGPFFGSGLGEADVRSLFVGMSPSGEYYCYFPMPFKSSINIELENQGYDSGGMFFIEIGYTSAPLKKIDDIPVGYFGAKYQRTWPITDKDDYILFDFKGRGAVVGQVMTVEPVKPDVKQWWEGDMRITIDGEKKPRFHGTGHEDEYQGGWSNFWMSNPYSLPLYGLPKSTGLINISGQINGSVTAYRFWPGKIPFNKSIRISTEHGTENNRSANYSSLVYYYFCNE